MARCLAWKVRVCEEPVCVAFAETRGRARHAIVAPAREVGYGLTYGDVRVERWPRYDRIAGQGPLTRARKTLAVVVAEQLLAEAETKDCT